MFSINVFKSRNTSFINNARYRFPIGSIQRRYATDLSATREVNIISRGPSSGAFQKHGTKEVLRNISENKREYIRLLHDISKPILICTGPTGTGKTYLACNEGLNQLLDKKFKKMVITRPTVSIDNEQMGFLPGNIDKKMHPWMCPIYDNIEQTIGYKELEQLIKYKLIEVCPFAYLRGRTFNNTIIIADEMQNSSTVQFKTILTRVGESSKLVINGDLQQNDNVPNNGLYDFLNQLYKYLCPNNVEYIDVVNLYNTDIIRNPCIKEILDIYSFGGN